MSTVQKSLPLSYFIALQTGNCILAYESKMYICDEHSTGLKSLTRHLWDSICLMATIATGGLFILIWPSHSLEQDV